MPRTTHEPEIDENIPLPPIKRGKNGGGLDGHRFVRIPYAKMQVGDSVFIRKNLSTKKALRDAVSQYRYRTQTPMRFAVRTWGAGFRVWRTE